jgi:hypothetical protein
MLLRVRTTIELLRRAKRRAADAGVALCQIVEAALRSYLGGPAKAGGYRLRWRTERGRLQPGVNLEDRDHLFDLMDGRR